MKELENDLHISISTDKEPYIKKITEDKIINLTGESGSGKSYFSDKWKDDIDYIIIDTDIVFNDKDSDNLESIKLRELFECCHKDLLVKDFDFCYKEILKYFADSNKTIVIDSAQYRNIKDISILKGEIIIMRTSIDKCYERCIERWKRKNKDNFTEKELQEFKDKKLGMYKWYTSLNTFIDNVEKL